MPPPVVEKRVFHHEYPSVEKIDRIERAPMVRSYSPMRSEAFVERRPPHSFVDVRK